MVVHRKVISMSWEASPFNPVLRVSSDDYKLTEAIYNGTKTQLLQGWFPEHKENK